MDAHHGFQSHHALPLLGSVPCPPGLHPGFLAQHAMRAGFHPGALHQPCPPIMFGSGFPPQRIPHPALEMGGLVIPSMPPHPSRDPMETGSPNKSIPNNFSIDNLMTAAAAAAAAMNNRKPPNGPMAMGGFVGNPFAIHPSTSSANGPLPPMTVGPPPPPIPSMAAFASLTPQQQNQAMAEAAAFFQNQQLRHQQNEPNSKQAGPWLLAQQAR